MKRPHAIFRLGSIVLGTVALITVLGFVERSSERTPVKDLSIEVRGDEKGGFIDEAFVRQQVLDMNGAVIGVPLGDMDIRGIEERLNAVPWVDNAQAYHTLDGVLHVRVDQREPVVRVFDRDGQGFYIDRRGYTMPTSDAFAPRVPVALGDLHLPYKDKVFDVLSGDSLVRGSNLDKVFRVARLVVDDTFWNALVDQIVVDMDGEVDLLPRVGAQRIRLGDGKHLEQRFAKLKLFYEKGMPRSDWRRYETIDLRFADQIVCTQRKTP
ncbi:MAG: hypothetical protein H6595_04245 [Flavobacteriales bacterium]|nr:hypothetical protein [Flavobacteriales bacterium]MCB9166670.1 hypothetical protein [Flavobacteriales bacterium]